MIQFSFWDILSNLLIATQWTLVLSLIAFVSGGIVGLILLFMRTSQIAPLEWFTKSYIEFFQGTPLLMQLFLFFFGIALFGIEVSPVAGGVAGAHLLDQRLPRRNLARLRRGDPARAMGGLIDARALLYRADALRHPAAGPASPSRRPSASRCR